MSKEIMFLDLVVVFASAFAGGWVAERLKQSPVIGYIFAGLLIGPHAAGLIGSTEMVENFAEIGIVLLMFTLGIEFSFNRLAEIKKVALLGGTFQILLTIFLTVFALVLSGVPMAQGFALGCILSLSSTMVVLKVLEERGDLRSVHGQLMVGFLIVQDLAAIFMFTLFPQLSAVGANNWGLQAKSLAISLILIALTIYLLQISVPRVMDIAARGTNRDVYLVFALVMALGVAFLAELLGLSLALGAFLGGLVVSESEYAHEVLGKVISLKDAFVILFFVAMGMMMDPLVLLGNIKWLALVLLLTIIIKFLVFYFIVRVFKYPKRAAFYVGAGMIQIGEFSFVLADIGLNQGLILPEVYNTILAASLITIFFTPIALRNAHFIYEAIRKIPGAGAIFGHEPFRVSIHDLAEDGHVVVIGHGRVGARVVKTLMQLGIPCVVVDYRLEALDVLRRQGASYVLGDAGNEVVLKEAGCHKANIIVLALPDPFINEHCVRRIKTMNPKATIIARAHNSWEKSLLMKSGVNKVVEPEEEASLEMIRQTMHYLGYSREATFDYTETLYEEQLALQGFSPGKNDVKRVMVHRFTIGSESKLKGKTLMQSGIKESTGCSVLSITKGRENLLLVNPKGDVELEEGDVLVIIGAEEQWNIFLKWLLNDEEESHV